MSKRKRSAVKMMEELETPTVAVVENETPEAEIVIGPTIASISVSIEQPETEPETETATEEPETVPAAEVAEEMVAAEPVAAEPPVAAVVPVDLLTELARLRAALAEIKASASAPETAAPASGAARVAAKPREATYRILARAPGATAHKTPQVAQLQGIIYSPDFLAKFGVEGKAEVDGKVVVATVTRAQMSDYLDEAKASGKLTTTQPALRIFEYYRSKLLASDCVRWQ